MAHEFHIKHLTGTYPVRIGGDLLERAGALIREAANPGKVAVVTDHHVAKFYWPTFEATLKEADLDYTSFILEAGEVSKSFMAFQNLITGFLESELKREDCVVALGGGVVGDVAGFAASVYMRGVNFINFPTTLLAQVDSSLGGKNGINMPQGKNMIGTIAQPRAVFSDVIALETLETREFRAGYAEMVKHAILDGEEAFQELEDNLKAFMAKDTEVLIKEISRSAKIKAAFIESDEKDRGQRQLLNLGHTFGHALEALAGYDDSLVHGEAVSIGLVLAFQYAVEKELVAPEVEERVRTHLEKAGLPTTLKAAGIGTGGGALLDFMRRDKKAKKGTLLVLPKGLGDVIYTEVPEAELLAFLEEL